MAPAQVGKAALAALTTYVVRRIARYGVKPVLALGAAGYSVDYQSSFVDLTQTAQEVPVSAVTLAALDAEEAHDMSDVCVSCDVQLWDVTEDVGEPDVVVTRPIESITTLYLHHTAADTLTPWHVIAAIGRKRGLGGMPYHFGLPRDGRILILTPMQYRTSHTAGHNSKGVSAVYPGNYEKYAPNEAQVEATHKLERLLRAYGINEVKLHREVKATACPGRYAVQALKR